MLIDCDELKTKRNKESVFSKGCYIEGEVRHEVAQSWIRCREKNINCECSLIEDTFKGEVSVAKHLAFLRDYTLQSVVSILYENLNAYKAALFYAYEDGVIFSQRGSKEMLQYLNSFNIGIGTCTSEEYLGTTGTALAYETNQETWVVGEEHYLNILTPFVSYCYYSEDFYGRTYTLIILPKENFTEQFHFFINLFHKARRTAIEGYRKSLELTMKNELFEQFLQNRKEAFLFLDSFGKIIYFNHIFSSWFKVNLDELRNVNAIEIIPELGRALDCLETGKKIVFEEILLQIPPANKQFVRMNVTPMTQNQVISGLVIQFSDSGHVRCAVNRISSAHAYYTFDNITGDSGAIKAVKQKAINVSKSNSSVVIMGESGTGKELFAQAIHNESLRKEGPFVAVNCASIPPELIASELFGYVEGAFTGARKGGSMGKFEYAHHGSLFLDEIGELPLYAQAILLRVLQERIVTRVGSNIAIPIDVRLISATNKNLRKMMKEGTFRSDLYFRIQVIPLYLPPLRERITDLPLHINYYLDYFNDCLGKNVKRVSPKALFYLLRYPWPGNLRELRNFIEYSINNAVGNTIELEDLSGDILEYFEGDELEDPSQVTSREKEFCTEERKKILRSLLEHNGNKSKVAEVLGIARSTLYHKIKEYKLD